MARHNSRLGLLALALLLAAATAWAFELPQTEARQDLRLRGTPGAVVEQLGRLFGVPVDARELSGPPLRLTLAEADFATALRIVAAQAGAFWVLQADGTVLVLPDTRENRQRHQPQVMQTFVLPGRSTEELTEAVRLLRTVLEMQRIRPDARSNTLTVRDTPRRLAVAEQLLNQLLDDPGEVMVELQLLEIDREKALRLGVLPPDQAVAVHLGAGALALDEGDAQSLQDILQFLLDRNLLPAALTEGSLQSLLQGGAIDPSQLGQIGLPVPPFILVGGGGTTYAVNLPGAELSLFRLARVTNSSRRLTLRAQAGQEATLFLGERFPIVFTTFSSIFIPQIVQQLIDAGQFIPPVPAVRYEELGLKLIVTPHIHPGPEITLAFKIEQSALTGREFNGIPVLAQRSLEQQVRLQEGETLLVSGMREERRENLRTQTPGLGSLPIIGYLFKQKAPAARKTELILLLTPRLTR
ncbi:MAG: type II secretion system protein GspD, partial [Terriglobia bacterium]